MIVLLYIVRYRSGSCFVPKGDRFERVQIETYALMS